MIDKHAFYLIFFLFFFRIICIPFFLHCTIITDRFKVKIPRYKGCTISDQSPKLKLKVLPSDFPNQNRPKTPNNPYPISKKNLRPLQHYLLVYSEHISQLVGLLALVPGQCLRLLPFLIFHKRHMTPETWQLTPYTLHLTHATWYVIRDTWQVTPDT